MGSREALIVHEIFMYEKENAKAHRTHAFDLVHLDPPTPILRRGQTFKIAISFNRPYDIEHDFVRLHFSFGNRPNSVRGTLGIGTITNSRTAYVNEPDAWDVKLAGFNDNHVILEVRSSVNSIIGIWSLDIHTSIWKSKKPPNTYKRVSEFYLLFNPWNNEDIVYMKDEKLLEEYILSDVGKIWLGDAVSAQGRGWIFGQFDTRVLPACMLVLEKSGIDDIARSDPISVSRAISKAINSPDDGGVLTGSWIGNNDDGTSPLAWTGSVPILDEFLSTGKSVKYGQCWVFAGVTTTVCRALGLPTRCVTNLLSAHDYNATLSIDEFYDKNNVKLNYDPTTLGPMDAVWNFHVWNDVWMSRPDLSKGYGGWQAVDSTPQERSNGVYQCGPASVEAIKQGIVGFNYDVTFLVSSVNADIIRWKEDPYTEFTYYQINTVTDRIGRMILTKAPLVFDSNGDSDREDITHTYKAPEGSVAERLNLLRAVRSTAGASQYYFYPTPDREDVEFKLVDHDRVTIGEEFFVSVNIKNKSSEIRKIEAILSAESVYYNGIKANMVTSQMTEFTMKPYDKQRIEIKITADDYLDKLVEYGIMKLHAIATVKETNQTWADSIDFQVLKPTIEIRMLDDGIVGKSSELRFNFVNPLKRTLTNCQINYNGPALTTNKTLDLGNIGPEKEVLVDDQILPQKSGSQTIVATFTSKELTDVTGSAIFEISG